MQSEFYRNLGETRWCMIWVKFFYSNVYWKSHFIHIDENVSQIVQFGLFLQNQYNFCFGNFFIFSLLKRSLFLLCFLEFRSIIFFRFRTSISMFEVFEIVYKKNFGMLLSHLPIVFNEKISFQLFSFPAAFPMGRIIRNERKCSKMITVLFCIKRVKFNKFVCTDINWMGERTMLKFSWSS